MLRFGNMMQETRYLHDDGNKFMCSNSDDTRFEASGVVVHAQIELFIIAIKRRILVTDRVMIIDLKTSHKVICMIAL